MPTMKPWLDAKEIAEPNEWECGSCGAIIDREIIEAGDLYHDPDEDCRAIREWTETNPDPFRRDSTGQAYGFLEDDPMQVEW